MKSIAFWPALFVHINYPRLLKVSFMLSQIIFFFFKLRSPKPAALGFSVPKFSLIISFDTQIP